MIGTAQALLEGAVFSAGGLLIVAGLGKLRNFVRPDSDSAVRRALGISRRRWRLVEAGSGALECITGTAVCAGWFQRVSGIAMAAEGAVFCSVLAFTMRSGLRGGCNCMGWRRTAAPITWRTVARAGWLVATGAIDATFVRTADSHTEWLWVAAGVVSGGVALILLSMNWPPRTPICHRPLWKAAGKVANALMETPVFQAAENANGPFRKEFVHRRQRCVDEFSFSMEGAQPTADDAMVFRVRFASAGVMAVQASARSRHTIPHRS
jgi:hypothetical protein